jgi:hypothetical protein
LSPVSLDRVPGGGLNLQAADGGVNLDLPWHPAKLEQRIARARRNHQPRAVQVINLVAEHTIEHGVLARLEQKRNLAEATLDGCADVTEMDLPSRWQAMVERVQALLGMAAESSQTEGAGARPTDPLERLRQDTVARWGERLQRLEVHGADTDMPLVLAVVDWVDRALEESLADVLAASFPTAAPRLELLDAPTYATVTRLTASGIMQAAAPGRILHGQARPHRAEHDVRAARLPVARERLAAADRPRRMAEVLVQGGFEAEALGPVGEVVKTALGALSHWLGVGSADSTPQDLAARLEREGWVPEGTGSLVEALTTEQRSVDAEGAAALVGKAVAALEAMAEQLGGTDRSRG